VSDASGTEPGLREPEHAALRRPDVVMRLERMGASHQTRLSFLRAMLRRAAREGWRFTRPRFDIDAHGVGIALYCVAIGARTYSLVAFGHDLPPDQRTDRVIAEAWDATFALYDGVPDAAELERLGRNVPRQEAGRYLPSDLILARANRSVRLFERVVASLSDGRQPEARDIEATGYLMRTTAVYGNGKFGIADRATIADRAEFAGPFRAEMLTVYLIRAFTVDLVEHMAASRGGTRATTLAPSLRRRLGIGNATGLGMAPFLVRHPALIDRWISARERALARVRALPSATDRQRAIFARALMGARGQVSAWVTSDPVQAPRIPVLAADLARLDAHVQAGALDQPAPWDRIYRWAEAMLSIEGQEMTVSLLIEPHGALVDDLADEMAVDEALVFRIDGRMRVADLAAAIDRTYAWAGAFDFARPDANACFWYVSEEKLEPRLGQRAQEPGADLEQPLAVARDIGRLRSALSQAKPDDALAAFLLRSPEHRHAVRRVQVAARHPYGEVRDNLIAADMRAIDLLRCKLAFFGVTRFDPQSDKWLRITLYQGAPFPSELMDGDWDGWIWGAETPPA
jgi:hypothetical protein